MILSSTTRRLPQTVPTSLSFVLALQPSFPCSPQCRSHEVVAGPCRRSPVPVASDGDGPGRRRASACATPSARARSPGRSRPAGCGGFRPTPARPASACATRRPGRGAAPPPGGAAPAPGRSGWRPVGPDGSCLDPPRDAAGTGENGTAFGRPGAGRGGSAFPQVRFAVPAGNGTHVPSGARPTGGSSATRPGGRGAARGCRARRGSPAAPARARWAMVDSGVWRQAACSPVA